MQPMSKHYNVRVYTKMFVPYCRRSDVVVYPANNIFRYNKAQSHKWLLKV